MRHPAKLFKFLGYIQSAMPKGAKFQKIIPGRLIIIFYTRGRAYLEFKLIHKFFKIISKTYKPCNIINHVKSFLFM